MSRTSKWIFWVLLIALIAVAIAQDRYQHARTWQALEAVAE